MFMKLLQLFAPEKPTRGHQCDTTCPPLVDPREAHWERLYRTGRLSPAQARTLGWDTDPTTWDQTWSLGEHRAAVAAGITHHTTTRR